MLFTMFALMLFSTFFYFTPLGAPALNLVEQSQQATLPLLRFGSMTMLRGMTVLLLMWFGDLFCIDEKKNPNKHYAHFRVECDIAPSIRLTGCFSFIASPPGSLCVCSCGLMFVAIYTLYKNLT